MALLGRGKQDGQGEVRRDNPRAGSMPPVRYRSAPVEPSRLGDALERKWEEAWRQARAADYNSR